jgi:hypothetical protein
MNINYIAMTKKVKGRCLIKKNNAISKKQVTALDYVII